MQRWKFYACFASLLGLGLAGLKTYPLPLHGMRTLALDFVLLAILLAGILGLGLRLLSAFKVYADTLRARLVFALGLGSLALSLIVQMLGSLGLLTPWFAYLLLAAFGFAFSEQLEAVLNQWRRGLAHKLAAPSKPAPGGWVYPSLLVWGFLVVLGLALAPPTFYDTLLYHLALPQAWVHSGTVAPSPSNLFSWLPNAGEMLTAFCLLLQGPDLAGLLNLSFGLALAFALADAAPRLVPSRPAWFVPALFFAQPVALLAFGLLNADGLMCLHAFLSLYAFLLAAQERDERGRRGWLWLAALLAGAAVADKPVAGIHWLVLAGLAVFQARRDKLLRKPAFWGVYLLLGLLPLLPSMIRNGILIGNPVYPFGLSVRGHELLKFGPFAYMEHMRGFGYSDQPWQRWLWLPWDFFFNAARFGSGGLVGPFLLGLVPALFFVSYRGARGILLAYLAASCALWAGTQQVLRYALAFLPALILLAACGVDELHARARSRTWNAVLESVLALFLAGGMAQASLIAMKEFDPYKVALGLEDENHYLDRRVSYAPVARWADEFLDPNAGILVLGESRTAYLPGRPLAATVFDQHPFIRWIEQADSPEALNRLVWKNNLRYVLINQEEWQRVESQPGPHYRYFSTPQKEALFRAWKDAFLQPRFAQGSCALYRVRLRPSPATPPAPLETPQP